MPKKILVIDDEKSVRDSFILALQKAGYEVDAFEDGNTGLESFISGDYDLVYLDLKMPGVNGAWVLKEIRKHDTDVPVYIVSAFYEDFAEELKNIKGKHLDFEILIKPLEREQIIKITRNILDGPGLL